MLTVYFGLDNKAVYEPGAYFDRLFKEDWLSDPVVRNMIKDVDKSEVLNGQSISSPVLGIITPQKLSGGVKTLILLWKLDEFYVDLKSCGENCCKWISYIADRRDIRCSMSSMDLKFKCCNITGICENDGEVITGKQDWIGKMFYYADRSKR